MRDKFESLNYDDVVSVGSDKKYLISHTTFKVAELMKLMRDSTARSQRQKGWFDEGIDCEILKPGSSWSPLHARLHRTLRSRQLLERNQGLLVAVTGGQDFLCLIKLLRTYAT